MTIHVGAAHIIELEKLRLSSISMNVRNMNFGKIFITIILD